VKYEPSYHPYLTKFLVFGEGSGVSAPLRFPSFQIRSDLQDRMFFTCQVPGSQVRRLTQPRSADLVSLLYVCMYVRGSRSMRRRDTMYISPAYVRTSISLVHMYVCIVCVLQESVQHLVATVARYYLPPRNSPTESSQVNPFIHSYRYPEKNLARWAGLGFMQCNSPCLYGCLFVQRLKSRGRGLLPLPSECSLLFSAG
jgi:hypothetical protein